MIIPLLLLFATAFVAPSHLSADTANTLSQNPETLSAYVDEYYADTPILAKIAWCESRMRQWGKDGKIFRGSVNKSDIGIMQVNVAYHEDKATDIGINLYTLVGNLAYAKDLYKREGTKPWASSQACWGK